MSRLRSTPAAVAEFAAAIAVVVSMLRMPAVVTRVGTRRSHFALVELPVLRWVVVLGLILVAATIADLATDRPVRRRLSLPLSATLLVGSVAGIVVLEWAVMLVPDAVLPPTLRRASVSVRAGAGLWTMAAAAMCAVVMSAQWYPALWQRVRSVTVPRERWLLGAAVVVGVGMAVTRYAAWVDLEGVGRTVEVPGLGLPWIGTLSLLGLWAFVIGVGTGFFVRHPAPVVVAITAGWMVSFLGALVILTSGAIGRAAALSSVASGRTLDGSLTATYGAWAAFAVGVGGAALLLGVLAERGAQKTP